ncbi:hypothetical protein ACS3QZ_18020 [Shimia sp. W99]
MAAVLYVCFLPLIRNAGDIVDEPGVANLQEMGHWRRNCVENSHLSF